MRNTCDCSPTLTHEGLAHHEDCASLTAALNDAFVTGVRICEACGHEGTAADIQAQLEDGEQGLYVLLCRDGTACMLRAQQWEERWELADMPAPAAVVESETPF